MAGAILGLQNRCGADKVPGGFNSHTPPSSARLRDVRREQKRKPA